MNQSRDLSTKEKILHASIDLFAGSGYKEVTVRDIARVVGIKASSLYKHYENKEAILESIFDLFKKMIEQTEFSQEELKGYIQTVSPEKYLNDSFALFKQVMWAPLTIKIAKIITREQQHSHSIRQFFIQEIIQKPVQSLQYVFNLMQENGSLDVKDTRVLAEEYSSYIIYLYFEQNFLNESINLDEIERKMNQHNNFYAQYILKRKVNL